MSSSGGIVSYLVFQTEQASDFVESTCEDPAEFWQRTGGISFPFPHNPVTPCSLARLDTSAGDAKTARRIGLLSSFDEIPEPENRHDNQLSSGLEMIPSIAQKYV